MKKTNVVLATILTGVIGLGSTAAIADRSGDGERSWKHHSGKHHGGKHGKRGGRHMMKRMAHKLDLTEDQMTQLKTFREEQKAANQALRDEMKQLRQDMQNLQRTDPDAVALIADRKGDLSERMFIAKNESRLAMDTFLDGILTEEQKEKLVAMKAEREARKLERQKRREARKAAKDAS